MIFLIFKYLFTFANNNDLIFLLKPIDKIVTIFTGFSSTYILENGYYYKDLNIILDKSCSGFNLWLLTFLIFISLFLNFFKSRNKKLIAILIVLIFAYFFTIFVNSSRIIVSIIIENRVGDFIDKDLLHEAIGIITNLSFLILTYFLTNKFLIKRKNNEKTT